MKKLVSLISIVCMLNVLAVAGLAGFLWATGRLDKPKVQAIADMLKHQGTPENYREKLYDIIAPPTTRPGAATSTAPAAQPALAMGGGADPATAEDRIDYMRQAMEIERLKLESEAQGLRDQQKLLVAKKFEVEAALTKLADEKKAFEQQIAAASSKDDGEGFKKSMALFDELKPKQVKDLFNGMTLDLAAKYLTAMEPDRAAKIIGEFKTPEEKAFVKGLLERIQNGTKESGTNSASAAAGATAVALTAASANAPSLPAKAGP